MEPHVIVLGRGMEITGEIKKFCVKNGIKSAYFTAIGAVSSAEVGSYSLEKKEYVITKFEQALELTNLTGNVSLADGEIVLHGHATFSDEQARAMGGHLMSAVVSITCEIFLTPTRQLNRKFDEETGLKLIEPC